MALQWTAFGASSSTALYVFLYSVHYFVFKTRMNGFFQTSFYFGCALLPAFLRHEISYVCTASTHGTGLQPGT
jgi:hypothetical protein